MWNIDHKLYSENGCNFYLSIKEHYEHHQIRVMNTYKASYHNFIHLNYVDCVIGVHMTDSCRNSLLIQLILNLSTHQHKVNGQKGQTNKSYFISGDFW